MYLSASKSRLSDTFCIARAFERSSARVPSSAQGRHKQLVTRQRAVAAMSYSSFHYEVQGKVQGVFFRVYTTKEAQRLNVVGYVQNTPNGHVEGEVQGEPDKVEEMKEWLKTTGSPASHIEKCTISDEKSDLKELSYSSFETRR